jgi:hypothetical protein
MTLMIQWSWRIENKRSIICGSWSEEEYWQQAFAAMLGFRKSISVCPVAFMLFLL